MFGAIARNLFGNANDRVIKILRKDIERINALEPAVEILSDDALRSRTGWLKQRLADGESEDALLADAFATVREASRRVLGLRPFDVQLMGGIVLHHGKIAEMKTGEGKTLVSTLPTYLNALCGNGVHVVTVNDYLAARDAAWMGQIYAFLGLSVGTIRHDSSDDERRAAYACDITYATNNELGFDYLRDNMKFRLDDMVQRPFHYALVDEVDSIFIDEARTPLIISGAAEDASDLYMAVDALMAKIDPRFFEKDEKARTVVLTEDGSELVENLLRESGVLTAGSLYDIHNASLAHHAQQALRAHALFQRDVDYMVKNGKVVIIDEFTGRMMEGRRYSEGLHQALEAKEKVVIQTENQTLASITFQNYFRLYPKIAGMTGTAMTEAAEFAEIYGLDVVAIPTNRPFVRDDQDDEVYRSADEKHDAIIKLIKERATAGQPILVGVASVEKSEHIAQLLHKGAGIEPQVLNARHHEQEARIIAQAGFPGTVTIATNMAGRGTDIQLGGNLEMRIETELAAVNDEQRRNAEIERLRARIEVDRKQALDAGGLLVIGAERHESRRIDNQLRGRSGRQGDKGASRFFLSLEDDLMRIFGSERLDRMLARLGLKDGEAIVHPWINRAIEKAQQKVEARNFDIRKNLLRFDDVMNEQRKVIYAQRRHLMAADSVSQDVQDMRAEVIEALVERTVAARNASRDTEALREECKRLFGLDVPIDDWLQDGSDGDEISRRLQTTLDQKMALKAAEFGIETWYGVERSVLLQVLDQTWKEHLARLDHLRQGISLRAYAQRDPLNEYKAEAFEMFQSILAHIREQTTQILAMVQIAEPETANAETAVAKKPVAGKRGPAAKKKRRRKGG